MAQKLFVAIALTLYLTASLEAVAEECADFVDDPDDPRFSFEGSFEDVAAFTQTLQKISDNSPAFTQYLEDIGCLYTVKDISRFDSVIPIRLERKVDHLPADYTAESIAIHGNKSDQQKMSPYGVQNTVYIWRRFLRLEMNNIDKLPHWEKVGNAWQVSNGINWATTREAVIVHEIAEFLNGLLNGEFDYQVDHAKAVELENAVRNDFGQTCDRGVDKKVGNTRVIHIGPNNEIWTREGLTLVDVRYMTNVESC